jgi:hypothetical protein
VTAKVTFGFILHVADILFGLVFMNVCFDLTQKYSSTYLAKNTKICHQNV